MAKSLRQDPANSASKACTIQCVLSDSERSIACLGSPPRWLTLNNIFGRFAVGARVRNGIVGSQDAAIGGLKKVARAIVVKKASRTATKKPGASPVDRATSKTRRPSERIAAQAVPTTLPTAMTGRASPAKAADGDKPVFAYISSLPQPQRGIAERVDALAAKTLPGLKRSVKWGIAWYGVGDGWCFCCGGFAGHVKLTFGRGTSLKPVPPVTPVGMGKDSRGVDLVSVDELDERQAASWMKQATAIPGFGGKKR
jgi:hypothetical protein